MRIVLGSGDILKAVLAGAKASVDPTYSVSYTDLNRRAEQSAIGALNGVTAVSMLTGSVPLGVDQVQIYNGDTAAISLTLQKVVNSVSYNIGAFTLAAGDLLTLDQSGAHVITSAGQIRTSPSALAPVALFPTSDGLTTGLIPLPVNGQVFVSATSASANNILSLPAAAVGDEVYILMGATGCKLISSVAADKCNNVVIGATNKAALVGTSFYKCKLVAANKWLLTGLTNLGAVETAIVPG